MAPRTRAKRPHNTAPTLEPSAQAAPDSITPLSNGDSLVHETDNPSIYAPDRRILWTPEPELYNPKTYTAWGRKHFGEEWYELRNTMLEERNFYILYDPVYRERQKALRIIEREKQEGNLSLKGKTWQELTAWARVHYGEVWYQHRETIARLEREIEETSGPYEDKLISKLGKHYEIMKTIQLDTDEKMLAEGKTWHDILAFPTEPSNTVLPIEADGYRSPSPSSDGDTDLSGYNTYPPSPTGFRSEAERGPDRPRDKWDHSWRQDGPEDQWDWRWDEVE